MMQRVYPHTAAPPVWFHDVLQPDGTPFSQDEVACIHRVTGGD